MCVKVSLFGAFSLRRKFRGQEYLLTEQDSTSKRLWTFLQYLAAFHDRDVSQDELIEALWGDSESSNPVNTLKTLLHRGRAMLERLGFSDGKQVLLYRRGVYSWNSELMLDVDAERFDRLCEQGESGDLEAAMQAIQIYKGDFLPSAAGSPWAVSMRTFYHTKFLKLCVDTAQALLERKEFNQVIQVCRAAISVDPFDENCHLMLMQAMAGTGQQQAAMQHYHEITSMLMDQLGVSPSEELTQLYRQLAKADMSMELDLGVVREKLLEDRPRGAFFCEYGVFQDIYQLAARSAMRNGQVVQLAMVTVLDENGQRLETERCARAMEELRGTIQNKLRAGDSFTRFSTAQYLILLPTASYENGIKVLDRILRAYQETLVGKATEVKCSLLPVQPQVEGDQIPGHFQPMS